MTELSGRRLVHVTTTDMSLALLLGPQLRAFAMAGMEVIGVSSPGPFVDQLSEWGIRHEPLRHATRSVAFGHDLLALPELEQLFRRLNPDIVHTHNPKPGLYGRLAARAAGVPAIVNTVHGLYATPDDPRARKAIVYTLERLAATCSQVELVQNPEDLDVLRRLRVPSDKLVLLGNGVDLRRFQPRADPAVKATTRAALSIAPDAVVAGTVGRLVWQKGFRELFAAAARLSAERPEVVFVVVGPEDPARRDALRPGDIAAARDLGNIVFTGQRDDVEQLYPGFDMYVLPSYREGFPRSAMEAAASGLPVIATDIRGCRQVVVHHSTGLLVPPRDAEALASAVAEVAADPVRREAMGFAARRKAEEDFDDREVIRRSIAAYERVTEAADSPASRLFNRRRRAPDGATTSHDRPTGAPLVIHVIPTQAARGAQKEARALADRLDSPGVRLHRVLSLFEGPEEVEADLKLGHGGGRTPAVGFDPRLALRLRAVLTRLDPAIVVAHGGDPLKYLVPAMGGRRHPLVYYATGTFSGTRSGTAGRAQLRLWRLLVSRAGLVAAEGEEVFQECKQLLEVPANRLVLAPNGRDPEVFHPRAARGVPVEVGVAERPGPAGSGRLGVVFAGALTSGKGPHRFLEVVGSLRAEGLSVRAQLAGDGPQRDSLLIPARAAGVELLGSRPDVAALLRQNDVMVFPSRPTGEGMPGILIEAGLSGLPVVTTAVPGATTIVADGETGLVVGVDDVKEMVAATARLLRDPKLRSMMGRAARRRCLERFTLSDVADRWAGFLDPLLPGSHGGSPQCSSSPRVLSDPG